MMETSKIFLLYIVSFVMIILQRPISSEQVTVSHVYWDGFAFYFPVSKQAVQDRLDQWHEENGNCESRRLSLPDFPIFPDLINEDQHPLYIDVGHIMFTDFENGSDPYNPLFYGTEVTVTIPFLISTQSHLPLHSLTLALFYDRSRGDFPKPNFIYNYIPVNDILFDDEKFLMRNGSDEMKMTFQSLHDPCVPPPDIVQHEFDDYITTDYQSGLRKPDFDYCDRHPEKNNFCSLAERLKPDINDNLGDLCQIWVTPNQERCVTSVKVATVTRGFRKALLLCEDQSTIMNVIVSEAYSGNFTMDLKYPCINDKE
ncbi:uncharacterized protein [Apostichopus japonicus]|uniref:uncharacterized protein n=1 Tax=Stichopus japonicus TaxID=307972 RepID=UPI003AB4B1D5